MSIVKLLSQRVDVCSTLVDAAVFGADCSNLCSHQHVSDFGFSASSPGLSICSHSSVHCRVGCEVISHYGFILCSFKDYWGRASFHIFIGPWDFLWSVWVFCPLFYCVICYILSEFWYSLYILYMRPFGGFIYSRYVYLGEYMYSRLSWLFFGSLHFHLKFKIDLNFIS